MYNMSATQPMIITAEVRETGEASDVVEIPCQGKGFEGPVTGAEAICGVPVAAMPRKPTQSGFYERVAHFWALGLAVMTLALVG